ncbi:hypothetical protein GJ496_010663 [Pomphorhynchus laevis]|nr:hypothetical protein GJ496_010663 [Pomphorhynchus laevis]
MRKPGDLRDSVDKKGGRTKRSASWLHASSTRVSTKRLITQLASYGLCIKDVMGDENRLFRSLSDQMIGESNEHLEYRNQLNQSPWRIRADFNSNHVFGGTQQLSLHNRHCQSMLLVSETADNQVNKISNRSLAREDLIQASRKSKDRDELHICYHSYPHYSSVMLIGDARGKTLTMIGLSELFEKYPVRQKRISPAPTKTTQKFQS